MARLPYLGPDQAEPHVAAIERGDLDAAVLRDDGRLVVRFTTQVVRDASPDEETFAAMIARFNRSGNSDPK